MNARSHHRPPFPYSRGRWAVERERLHLEPGAPPMPMEDGHPLAESLAHLVDRFALDSQGWTAQCEAHWPEIVGTGVGQHTRPGKLMGTCLVVYVDTSVWLAELSRNGQQTMLKRLQERFGVERIGSLSLRLDPGR